jgi:hypothetical protein
VLFALLLSTHLAFADLPKPGDPDNPTSPTSGVALDVLQEGMYDVTASCAPTPDACNTYLAQMLNRVSVIDSHSMLGVWVNIASTNPSDVIDGFYAAAVGPDADTLTAEPRQGGHTGHFSYVNFKINPATGILDGTAYDYESAGHYVLHGKPLVRIGDLMNGSIQTGMSSDVFIAKFHGALNGITGTLLVNKSPDGKLFAHFGSDSGSLGHSDFELNFNGGAWNTKTGLLQLVFENPRFEAEGELALVLRPDGTLQAIYINGFVSSLSTFVRTS